MESFSLLMQGLSTALEPMILLYALIGVTLGTAVGVLPGIGPALTVALLLPVTYGMRLLRDVMLRGAPLDTGVVAGLAGFGVAMFLLALAAANRRLAGVR